MLVTISTPGASKAAAEQQHNPPKQGLSSMGCSNAIMFRRFPCTPVLVLALIVMGVLYMNCSTTAVATRLLSREFSLHTNSSKRHGWLTAPQYHTTRDSKHLQLSGTEVMPAGVWGLLSAEADAAQTQPVLQAAPGIVPDLSKRTEPVLPDVARLVRDADKQSKGRRIISMSLYGTQQKYVEGAIANAMLARRDWRGWTMRVYYGDGVPDQVLHILQAFGTEVIRINRTSERASSTMWRFLVATDPTVSRFISRDADARLSRRDKAAVDEWIESGMFFHTMHDHAQHGGCPVLAGMWGAINGFVNPAFMLSGVESGTGAAWGIDQAWLAQQLWPHVRNYTLDHASYTCGEFNAADNRGFPTKREDEYDFVGNVYEPPTFVGAFKHSGPCPERCRRNPEWIIC